MYIGLWSTFIWSVVNRYNLCPLPIYCCCIPVRYTYFTVILHFVNFKSISHSKCWLMLVINNNSYNYPSLQDFSYYFRTIIANTSHLPHHSCVTLSLPSPWNYFITGMRDHNLNLLKITDRYNVTKIIQSSHNFAHAMTVELSWHKHNLYPTWPFESKTRANIIVNTFQTCAQKTFVKWFVGRRVGGRTSTRSICTTE